MRFKSKLEELEAREKAKDPNRIRKKDLSAQLDDKTRLSDALEKEKRTANDEIVSLRNQIAGLYTELEPLRKIDVQKIKEETRRACEDKLNGRFGKEKEEMSSGFRREKEEMASKWQLEKEELLKKFSKEKEEINGKFYKEKEEMSAKHLKEKQEVTNKFNEERQELMEKWRKEREELLAKMLQEKEESEQKWEKEKEERERKNAGLIQGKDSQIKKAEEEIKQLLRDVKTKGSTPDC